MRQNISLWIFIGLWDPNVASTWKIQLMFQKGWVGRACWINGLLLQVSVFTRKSITRSKRDVKSVPLLPRGWMPPGKPCSTPYSTAKGYRACIQRPSESSFSASPPLTQSTKRSFYFLAARLKVYIVSIHVAIFIFPSIPINFLTHFTQLTFLFTSISLSSAHSTCVNYFSRQCDHCKWAHLRQGLPTSPSHRWPQPLWSPEHDLNYSQLPSMGSGGRHCPRLVLFHTCSLFISRHNGGAWSENPKMW